MSLRPRDPNSVARMQRASGRMAPGGRRWSESPIPRPGVRRPRAAGVEAAAYLVDTGSASGFGGSSISPTLTMAAGDVAVVVAACQGASITQPSGWTVLDSGTISGLRYVVAHITSDGSDDLAFAYGAGGYAVANGVVYRDAAGLTPTATVVETASGTSVTFPATSGTRPWQAIGFCPASPPTTFTMTYAPDNSISTNYSTSISQRVTLHGMYPAKDDDLANYPGPLSTSWSLSSSVTGEWFTVALGLA